MQLRKIKITFHLEQVKYGFKIILTDMLNDTLCLQHLQINPYGLKIIKYFFSMGLSLTYPRFLILRGSVPDAHCTKKKKIH